jgi:uncharacterized phage protein (TIGR01671 family)
MNRIPNYRVWHKIEKRFVDLRSIDFELDSIGYDCYREANYYDIAKFDEIVFQQFTELYDKNKKPIYEGDIIRGMFNMGPAGEVFQTAPVEWNSVNGYQWNYWNLDSIEVIGNIFENE